MTNRKKPKGWVKEPVRHGLAAKGVKTATVRGVTYREDSGVMMEPLLKAEKEEKAMKARKTGRKTPRELALLDFPEEARVGRFEATIIQFPSGKWGLVGSIPAGLADRVFDTAEEAAQAFVDEEED